MKLNQIAEATYDTEAVRQLFEHAEGRPQTILSVANAARPGKMLHDALIRRGVYDRGKVTAIFTARLRRRLAKELGRISPRFLNRAHDYICPECKGVAVEWDGTFLCENGHRGQV